MIDAESTREQPASIWSKNFILICFANLSLFLSIHMLLPTLPLYLLDIGGTQRDVGYVMGAYTLGATLMRVIAGWLVDRYGRKINLISGLTIMLAVTFLYRLSNDVSIIIVTRVLHGLTFGLVSTALGTMVADILPTARMGEGIGYFGLTSTFSMALAPIIGLWLINKFSYTLLFIAIGLFTVLSLFNSLLVRNTGIPINGSINQVENVLVNLLEKTSLLPSAVTFFLALIYSAVLFFIAIYAATFGIGNVGSFFAAISLTMVIFRPLSGRWADSGRNDMVFSIGFLTMFSSLIVIGLSSTITGFLFAGALYGIGFSCSLPLLQAVAVRRAPAHRRGDATATYFMALDMGIGLGAILWGFVAEASSFQVMYFTTLIPLVLAVTIYFRYRKRMV